MAHGIIVAAIAGLGGMLGWGLADFFAKKTIDRIGDLVSLVWAHLAGSLILLVLVLPALFAGGAHVEIPSSPATWTGLALFGALQAAVYLFAYIGFGKGQVAVLSPVFASYSGLVALISVLALGEVVTAFRALALLAVFLGILVINLDLTALRSRRVDFVHLPGSREIAIAAGLATVWTLGWNSFVRGHDGVSYASLMYLFMTLTLFGYAGVRRIPLRFADRSVWLLLALIGLCEVIAYAAISLGYGLTTHASVVALVSGAFSLPTMLLARIFLRERLTTLQWAGCLILIAGVAVLPVL